MPRQCTARARTASFARVRLDRMPRGRGHGHDLLALAEPRWMWVETFGRCGNGVVEGAEECDDGSRRGGDGCDVNCQACCWEPVALQTVQRTA